MIIGKETAEFDQTVKTHITLIIMPTQVDIINGFTYFAITAFKINFLYNIIYK